VGGDGNPAEGPGLDDLSRLTGGYHYVAADATALDAVVRQVDRAEAIAPPPPLHSRREWYPSLLLSAALLLALARWRAGRVLP
jgi:hypothetical protein